MIPFVINRKNMLNAPREPEPPSCALIIPGLLSTELISKFLNVEIKYILVALNTTEKWRREISSGTEI